MKPTKTFNLTKTTKRMMAAITNKDMRDSFKNCMIQAQLVAETKPVSTKDAK